MTHDDYKAALKALASAGEDLAAALRNTRDNQQPFATEALAEWDYAVMHHVTDDS